MDGQGEGPKRQGPVVLLIDEDPKVGRLVRAGLSGSGCQVLASTRHEEGLRLIEHQRPDLIILEQSFQQIDGRALLEQVLEASEDYGPGVVVLTGEASLVSRLELIQRGAADFILKSDDARAMGQRLQIMMARAIEGVVGPVSGPTADELINTVKRVEEEAATGKLALSRQGEAAQIIFQAGQVHRAEYGRADGEMALNAIAKHGDWEIQFDDDPNPTKEEEEGVPEISESSGAEDIQQVIAAPPRVNKDEVDAKDLEAVAEIARKFPEDMGTPVQQMVPATPEALARWLKEFDHGPLLLVLPPGEVRSALKQVAEKWGLTVITSESGEDAFSLAHQHRPLAILCNSQLKDVEGRDLLASVRCDFVIREIPFLILSNEDLEQQAAHGKDFAEEVFMGIQSVLGPRVKLFKELREKRLSETPGWVEPIGIRNLFRALGMAKLSGLLLLRTGEQRNAEVIFERGQVCGATVNSPQSSVGPMAMLNIMGYEWKEYYFRKDPHARGGVPLGDLDKLVETACRKNNVLVLRLFQQGTRRNDVVLNYTAMDNFMHSLPANSLDLFMQLGEGEPAANLVESGAAPAAVLKSLLFEMRRKAVIRATSMRPVRLEDDPSLAPEPRRMAFKPIVTPAPALQVETTQETRRPRTRWAVVLITGLVTIGLAAAGYWLLMEHDMLSKLGF